MKKSLVALMLALPMLSVGEEKPIDAPPPPQLPPEPQEPPEVRSGEVPEPEVTIIERKDKTVEQYSIKGRVYMVKITPRKGPPYYLLDLDGDGLLDVRRDSPDNISVPQWVLFSW